MIGLDENGKLIDTNLRYETLLTPDISSTNIILTMVMSEKMMAVLIGLLIEGTYEENWTLDGTLTIPESVQEFHNMVASVVEPSPPLMALGNTLITVNGQFIGVT